MGLRPARADLPAIRLYCASAAPRCENAPSWIRQLPLGTGWGAAGFGACALGSGAGSFRADGFGSVGFGAGGFAWDTRCGFAVPAAAPDPFGIARESASAFWRSAG